MQERYQNITDKIEKVKLLVEDIKDNGWKVNLDPKRPLKHIGLASSNSGMRWPCVWL